MRARPASSNRISLAAMCTSPCALPGALLLDDAEDVVLAQNQVIDAVDLDVAAGVLAEQHPVALLDCQRANLALLVRLAFTDRDHLALGGLLLGGVGDDDAAFGLLF